MQHMLAFQMPGLGEWIVIAAIGLLLFGKRLPEVGKNVGKTIVEFKKGLKEAEAEVQQSSLEAPPSKPALPAEYKFDPHTGQPINRPRFDPYTGKPLDETATLPSENSTSKPA
jgi:sec-independent protein translocase protein TatA